jgi:hypothetical protein
MFLIFLLIFTFFFVHRLNFVLSETAFGCLFDYLIEPSDVLKDVFAEDIRVLGE